MKDIPTYIQVRPVELELGVALPWDLYDKRGILVLREGTLLTQEEQIERLLARRVCRERTAADVEAQTARPVKTSAFAQLFDLKSDLNACLHALALRPGSATLEPLLAIASQLRELANRAPDAMLAALQLEQAAYTDLHPLLVAVIGELVARRLELDEALRDALCRASLTSNLGMLDLQAALSCQAEPLDAAQRRAVRDHPEQGFELLRTAGVTDEMWLGIVLQHHERGDGSGYPHGRATPQFELLTSILALSDNYAAMVLPRAYRQGLHAQQAMREIFMQRRVRVADDLARQFVKELGVYPPGAFVTMKNGDHGLVIRRGQYAANAPVVSCFASAGGVPYPSPLIHDTGEAGATVIAGIAAPTDLPLPLARLCGLVR